MERELPSILIEGTRFFVDVDKERLVQTDNAENIILFPEMDYHGDHYKFDFNKLTKSEHYPWDDIEGKVEVTIPTMVKLDPEGMADRFNIDLKQISEMNDMYLRNGMEAFTDRINGILPKIKIGEENWIVDWLARELRFETGGYPKIDLTELRRDEDETYFECYFDTKQRCVAGLEEEADYSPDTVRLVIPDELVLDPVGVARQHRKPDTHYLNLYPIQKELRAKLLPLNNQKKKVEKVQQNRKKGNRI